MRLGALRMAKAALMNQEVQKGRPLDEAESQQVMTSLIKQRRDSIEQFRKGGRDDLADKEAAEITTLEAYLPPPIDAAGLERLVDDVVTELGASGPKDLGKRDEGASCRGWPDRPLTARRSPSWSSDGWDEHAPNFFRWPPSNHSERHAQASHPSSIRLLPQGRSLFLYAWVHFRHVRCSKRPHPNGCGTLTGSCVPGSSAEHPSC